MAQFFILLIGWWAKKEYNENLRNVSCSLIQRMLLEWVIIKPILSERQEKTGLIGKKKSINITKKQLRNQCRAGGKKRVIWFGSWMFPKGTYVKGLDPSLVLLVGGSIFMMWTSWKKIRSFEVYSCKGLGPWHLSLCLCFLVAMRWPDFLWHMLTPWGQAAMDWNLWNCKPKNLFSFYVHFLRYFVTVTKNWLIQTIKYKNGNEVDIFVNLIHI